MNLQERLFWKIIHNKYIFKYILKTIRNSFIKYERIDLIYSGNRIGYGEINKLHWIIEKRQYSILLDKIESNKYIHIDKSSIELLLKNCQNIEILSKLYDNQKYFKQLSMVDLIKSSITYTNEQSLKLLLKKRMKLHDGEFILPIYPSTCLLVIQNSNVSMLHHLFTHLSNRNEITDIMDPIKNQLLKVAISNLRYKDDIISFLFDNQYYTPTSSSSPSPLPTISYYELSQLKSIDNKSKILEMGQVKVPPDPLYDIKFTNIDKMNEKELMFIILVIFKLYKVENQQPNHQLLATYKQIQNITCLETRKKQFKLFIIQQVNSEQLFLNYLIQYNEIIPNYKDQVVTMYTFSTFKLNGLNYLIDKYLTNSTTSTTSTNEELQISFSIELFKESLIDSISKSDSHDEFIEFIKLYLSNEKIKNTFKFNDQWWCLILKTMILNSKVTIDILDSVIGVKGFPIECLVISQLDITPFSKYKWYINKIKTLIQPDQFKLYNQIPPLNQNEVIEFIIENHNFYQLQQKYTTCQFKSIDKINYFKSVITSSTSGSGINGQELQIDYSKLDYNKSFFKSLSNGDINSLETDFTYLKITDFQNGCFNHFNDIQDYKLTFNYLNEKGFKLYGDQLFTDYINELFNSYSDSQLNSIGSDGCGGLVIGFNQFPKQSYSILVHQILFKLNLSIIKFICNQYQNIFNQQTEQEEMEIKFMNIPIVISKTTNFKSKFKYQNVLDLINYLIQFNNSGDVGSGKSTILNHIFNILYKVILSTMDFKFEYIDQLIQLFEKNEIQIQQTAYHYFYYFLLKDIRFGKYLIYKRQSFFGKLLSDLNYESIIVDGGSGTNSTSNILNGFTFKEIENGDFETLFLKLRNQLNVKTVQQTIQPVDSISLSVILKSNEQDYLFLLECGEIDLFFQLVNQVNSNKSFGNYEFNFESSDIQPYFFDIKNHLIKSLSDKQSILNFLSIGIKEYNVDTFLEQCLNESRLDNIKYLLSKQTTFKINSIAEYQFQQLFKYNHIDIIEYLFINHKQLILINLNNSLIGQSSTSTSLIGSVNNSNNKLSIFDICFQNGQIGICDLLLLYFPSFFNTIKTNIVYNAIRNNQISIIIHYILTQPDKIINSVTDDTIIDSLSYHNDYKYLNLNKLIKK